MTAENPASTRRPLTGLWSRRRQLATLVFSIGLIVGIVLAIAAETGTVFYTTHEDLRYAPGTFVPNNWYAPSLNNSRGERTASIEFLFPSSVTQANETFPMMLSVWHVETTHLDSFDLTLSSLSGALWVWLNPSSGGTSMQITSYGSKVVISFTSLAGNAGSGTVGYNIIVQPIPFPRDSTYQLSVEGHITLHDTNYLFVQHVYSADVVKQFSIAPNGAITG